MMKNLLHFDAGLTFNDPYWQKCALSAPPVTRGDFNQTIVEL